MQEKISFVELDDSLLKLYSLVLDECEQIRIDMASLSFKLNDIGYQGVATSVVDNAFQDIKYLLEYSLDYIKSLIEWIDVNVEVEYDLADEIIQQSFSQRLNSIDTRKTWGYDASSHPYGDSTRNDAYWTLINSYGK